MSYTSNGYQRVVGTGGTLAVGASGSRATLRKIVVTKFAASGVVTVKQGTTVGSGDTLIVIDVSTIAAQKTYEFCIKIVDGFNVAVTGGAAEILVTWD